MAVLRRACILGAVLCAAPLAHFAVGLGIFSEGNTPIDDRPYAQWSKIMLVINDEARVFHAWVNGNEGFYFKGNVQALNHALRNFSRVDMPEREVVLLPESGVTECRKKAIPYNWRLELKTGIAKYKVETLTLPVRVLAKAPTIYVCVNDDIALSDLQIPDGVTVVGPSNRERTNVSPSETAEERAVAEQGHAKALEKIDEFISKRNQGDAKK
jgi:hypothetical protein